MKHYLRYVFLLFIVIGQNSHASEINYDNNYHYDTMEDHSGCNDLADPLEPINRKIFYFNSFLDMIILKPVAVAYDKTLNDFTKTRIGDFVDNVYEPLTSVNYLLQLDLKNTFRSLAKFCLNTTFGLLGTFDIGTKMGIDHKPQNFGSTLAYYGARPGPYIVLPILGSTNMRDMWNLIAFDDAMNPVKYGLKPGIKNAYTVTRVVHKRYELMPFTNYIVKTSSDPYVSIRSAYHQRRESDIQYPSGYKCGVKIKKSL